MNLSPGHHQMKLGVFLLQLPQLGQHRHRVRPLGQGHPVGHHRLQHRSQGIRFRSQGLSGPGLGQARHRRQASGLDFLRGGKFLCGVAAQLLDFFLLGFSGSVYITYAFPDFQTASGNLQPGEPAPLGVPGDFIHPGGKFRRIFRLRGVGVQDFQQLCHPLKLQGRAEAAGKQLPPGNQLPQVPLGHRAGFQVIFQQGLVAQGGVLGNLLRRRPKIHTSRAQLPAQFRQQFLTGLPGQVHFVDKQEGGHLVPLQQPPQGHGVGLQAIGAADHQHGAVQNGHGPLRLGGEVHVTRGIHQGDLPVRGGESGLLGENGNASGPFQCVGVQHGIPMIHPAQGPPGAADIEQPLAEGGLSRVHMSQQPHGQGGSRCLRHCSNFLSAARFYYCITVFPGSRSFLSPGAENGTPGWRPVQTVEKPLRGFPTGFCSLLRA